MNHSILKELWEQEEKNTFKGWDFSHLKDRWTEEELPWDYRKIVLKHLNLAYRLLDMGTGGGEVLWNAHIIIKYGEREYLWG